MKTIRFSAKKGMFTVNAFIHLLGEDLLVIFEGGKAHIGAVSMAQPRPSLKDPREIASTASVFTYVGHKEDVIAKEMAEEFSRALNRKVVVVAGLHWDNIRPEEIEEVKGICNSLKEKVIARARVLEG